MIIGSEAAGSPLAPSRRDPSLQQAVERSPRNRRAPLPTAGEPCAFSLDNNGRIASLTPGAAAWFGVDERKLVGSDPRQSFVIPPQVASAITSCFGAKYPSVIVCGSDRRPGRWVEYRVDPMDDGATVSFRELPLPERQSARPRRPETCRAGIVEIVLLDEDCMIVSANAAWREELARQGLDEPLSAAGSSYLDVVRRFIPDFDEVGFLREFLDLEAHPANSIVRTYEVETDGLRRMRQLQITVLPGRGDVRIVATHEDLTGLPNTQLKLRSTGEELQCARQAERQRIALELHDSTSQHLAALGFGVSRLHRLAAQVPGVDSVLAEMTRSLQETMKEVRVLSYLMKPPNLERDGLTLTAARFVRGFGARAGLEVSFKSDGLVDRASGEARHAAFRVIQEALSNVHRHAHATHVEVVLKRRGGRLDLRIADDGKGFAALGSGGPEAITLGVGIEGMRARVEALGGLFAISCNGGGATVKVTMPDTATDNRPGGRAPRRIDRAAS